MDHCGAGDGLATGPHAADPTGPRQHPRLCGVSWASGSLCVHSQRSGRKGASAAPSGALPRASQVTYCLPTADTW